MIACSQIKSSQVSPETSNEYCLRCMYYKRVSSLIATSQVALIWRHKSDRKVHAAVIARNPKSGKCSDPASTEETGYDNFAKAQNMCRLIESSRQQPYPSLWNKGYAFVSIIAYLAAKLPWETGNCIEWPMRLISIKPNNWKIDFSSMSYLHLIFEWHRIERGVHDTRTPRSHCRKSLDDRVCSKV